MAELVIATAFLLLPTFILILLVPVILLRLRKRRSKIKLPPGPAGVPLIGNLHMLLGKTGGAAAHETLYKLSKVYGPLMWLRLGCQAVIVASSPSAARQILQTNDQAFSSRPRFIVPSTLHNCADLFFASPAHHPHWKFLRQLCTSHLFSKRRLDSFRPLRTQEVRALLTSILASVGAPLNMRAQLHNLGSNIICRMALGKRLSEIAMPASGVQDSSSLQMSVINLAVEMNTLLGAFNFGDFFPTLAWLDIQGYGKQTKVLTHKAKPILQEIIDERHRDYAAGHRDNGVPDFLDLLLQAAASVDAPITDANIKAVILNIFGGGIDTSSITIEWALEELLTNPTKLLKLQEELEHIVGMDRLVEELDIPRLPYLQAVVKETMRLHPVVPLLAPHLTNEACKVLEYDIPPNTVAYINVWAIGRDPNTWEEPLKFLPERFLGNDIDVNGQYFELLPFGSGRRGCPGWTLGLVTVQITLASLIQCFHFTVADKLDMTEDYSLVLTSSKPLIVEATPRLVKDVLQEKTHI